MPNFSDYIVFADESGDHGLKSIDPNYPMFVLAFCIFEKESYITRAVPDLLRFKFKHCGHDQVVLHEHDMRKTKEPFLFLFDAARREPFYGDLNQLIAGTDFCLVASAIRKTEYRERYAEPGNPYHVAMGFGLERVFLELHRKDAAKAARTSYSSGEVPLKTRSWSWSFGGCAPTMPRGGSCPSTPCWCRNRATRRAFRSRTSWRAPSAARC